MVSRLLAIVIFVCIVTVPAVASIAILDSPDSLDGSYDLCWQMTPLTGRQAVSVAIEGPATSPAYRLTFTASTARWESGTKRERMAATRHPLCYASGRDATITFKRRPGTIAVLLDHRLIFTAPAPRPIEGVLAFDEPPPGVRLRQVRYHPVDAPAFGDDFMRPEALEQLLLGGDQWIEDPTWTVAYYRRANPGQTPLDPATGKAIGNPWQLSLYPHPEKTTNAFWMCYTGTGPSWVVANPLLVYPSWDHYAVTVSVKPEYGSTVGVLVAYQDPRNYLLFRWHPQATAQRAGAELIACVAGRERVLATALPGFVPDQWYRLRVALTWTRVSVTVDDAPLLAAANPGPIEGRIGLYADGDATSTRPAVDAATAALYAMSDQQTGRVQDDPAIALRATRCVAFDDVLVQPAIGADDVWTMPEYAHQQTGRWRMVADGMVSAGAGGRQVQAPLGDRWTLATTVTCPPTGSVTLCFDHANQSRVSWVVTPAAQSLLGQVANRAPITLDSLSLSLVPNLAHRLRVERDGAYLACSVDDRRVLETYGVTGETTVCRLDTATGGARVGALAWGMPLSWAPGLRTLDSFTRDAYIRAWAGADADWVPDILPARPVTFLEGAATPWPTDDPGLYWHKGFWCHDVQLTLPVAPANLLAEQQVYLAPTRQTADGLVLTLERRPQGGVARLRQGERVIGEYPFSVREDTLLQVLRRGGLLILRTVEAGEGPDSETLLGVTREPAVAAFRFIGMQVTNRRLPATAARIDGDRVQETFAAAPTDWWAREGVWAVMARYSCSPWWNWFGGFGAGTPAIWSKARLTGDQSVEAYLGVKMLVLDQPEEYQRRFRDLNLTICGDGRQVLSGYTLQRATRVDGQPVTRLLRQGVVVWSSTDPAHLLPPQGQGHRHWFATRLEKVGDAVSVFLDNRLATVYRDPAPLNGGQVAIWTQNNGILVGRVNWSCQTR